MSDEMRQMRQDLGPVVDAAQRVSGVIAARGRGDVDGARALLASFDDHEHLAAGALLVAELALGMHSRQTGRPVAECAHELAVELESSLGPDDS